MRIIKKIGQHKTMVEKSPPAHSTNKTEVDDIFDNLARSMAGSLTRREALKMAVTGFAAMALTKLGISPAWAATCLCNGVTLFDPDFQCCTPTGVVSKRPIANLNNCPGKVPNPTFTCNPSGCSGLGIGTPPLASVMFGILGFDSECNTLYCCLATCNNDGPTCLEDFTFSAGNKCLALLAGGTVTGLGPKGRSAYGACVLSMIWLRGSMLGSHGPRTYENLQKLGCDCCGSHTCSSCMPGTFPCSFPGSNDKVLNCCPIGYRCSIGSAGYTKCCPPDHIGFSDTSGIVQCCPPKTFGFNDKSGGFSCVSCDSDLGRSLGAAFCASRI